MKLTNKLWLLVAVAFSLSACATVQTQTLYNGDVKELATQSNAESEGTTLRIYRGSEKRVIAQHVVIDDSLGGDILRSVSPVAAAKVGDYIISDNVAKIKSKASTSPTNVISVTGGAGGTAQAVSNSAATSESKQQSQTLGPCGRPTCPQLGSAHLK